jgi:HD-GYP domain-containing protein (c-di-GMP phosphodiesterase class II)
MGATPAHRLIPVNVEQLEPGMFVAELDRSWLHTSLADMPEGGFLIQTQEQITRLRANCRYVYVDLGRSDFQHNERLRELSAARHYTVDPLYNERALLEATAKTLAALIRSARRHGRLDISPLREHAAGITEQILKSPDRLLWVIRTDPAGSYVYRRAIGTAICAAVLAHRLGMDRQTLTETTLGGLLLDIGKVAVPVPILAKPQALDLIEQSYVRRHVERGVELLSHMERIPNRAIEMMMGHHERMDGSGYPHALRDTEIPLFARIAAIADTFDALTLNRRYAAAQSPHDAMQLIDGMGRERFDDALVGEFLYALGVFPTGTEVELMDGSLGIVWAQQPTRPSAPNVAVAIDPDGGELLRPRLLPTHADHAIVRALPPGTVLSDPHRLERSLAA